MDARFVNGCPLKVPYIPGSAVVTGAVVVIGDVAFVADNAIEANAAGVLSVGGGIYKMTSGEAIAAGKKVYWNDTTNKLVETATTGKAFGIMCPGESAAGADEEVLVFHFPDFSGSTPAAVVAPLTDSTGGTANSTLAAVGVTNTGDRSSDINNNFADIAAKIAAIITALQDAGLMKTA